jgi:ATP-dependent Lon protease
MRDFRDAKTMAQTLRESLTTKAVTISHSESLELVSKILGVSDWNTLSALLQADRRETGSPAAKRLRGAASYPAIPLRDFVPFPTTSFPLFVGREKTIQALDRAFERQREVVLAVQKQGSVDEPGFDDVYEVGVLAKLLELQRLDGGTLKVLAQAHRRVVICRFIWETGAFEAEIADISEGPIRDAPFLIKRAVTRFESYAAERQIHVRQIWPPLDQTREPGRVADIIASCLPLPISDRQGLLATLDPVARLEKVDAFLNNLENASRLPPAITEVVPGIRHSPELETTLRQALVFANQRKHEYATLEHLLLALTEDAAASAVMKACKADLGVLREKLAFYLDNELKRLVIGQGGDARPTAAFQRVTQRAALLAQESDRAVVTGANVLLAIFAETQSPAARLLGEQGVSTGPATALLLTGIGKRTQESD